MNQNCGKKTYGKLGISPKHLNRVEFAMELWKKKANMAAALNVMLDNLVAFH